MKYLHAIIVLFTITGLSLGQEKEDEVVQGEILAEKPSNEDLNAAFYRRLPVHIVAGDERPDHGVCYVKTFSVCLKRGEPVPYDGKEKCVSCFCGEDFRPVCCKESPYPVVKNWLFCKVDLNEDQCEYKRQPKCKPVCKITGWYTTKL